MYIYFTIHKDPTDSLTLIFNEMTLEQAKGLKKALVSTSALREDQITLSRRDSYR